MTTTIITRLVEVIANIQRLERWGRPMERPIRRRERLSPQVREYLLTIQEELQQILGLGVEFEDPSSPNSDTTPTRIIGR